MRRYIVLCLAVAAMLAVLYVFDYFSLQSGISGAAVTEDKISVSKVDDAKLPPGDSCYLDGSSYVCLSTKARYSSRNSCRANCRELSNLVDFYNQKCAARGESPKQGQSCCVVDIACSFCGNKCSATCPDSSCKAPDGVSCLKDEQCAGGSCSNDVCAKPSVTPVIAAVESAACNLKDGSYVCRFTNKNHPLN